MDKVNLDKDDVKAIASQRAFKLPPKTNRQNLFERVTFCGTLALLLFGAIVALFGGNEAENDLAGALILAGLIFAVVYAIGRYRNNASLREAQDAFVKHWEKTGEIKPRWEILTKDESESRETPPDATK